MFSGVRHESCDADAKEAKPKINDPSSLTSSTNKEGCKCNSECAGEIITWFVTSILIMFFRWWLGRPTKTAIKDKEQLESLTHLEEGEATVIGRG